MSARFIRAGLCLPLGLAAMSVYAHSLGGIHALNLQQGLMSLALVLIPSALCLIKDGDQ